MAEPILIARRDATECHLLPELANRHGLITGATGTGKTITLQTLAEQFSLRGVPVFLSDIKGDLTGISQAGTVSGKLAATLHERGIAPPGAVACPTTLWDVFGTQGHPVRATVSDMGPLLLSRMLDLNDTQQGVMQLVFKIADDNGMLLLDLKDLRAMLQHVGENARQFTTQYGNISPASVGAIQRGLLQIEAQGGDIFFGEPMLDIHDFMQTMSVKAEDGTSRAMGVINILAADQLMNAPRLYATFLLWMLSELFEALPEVGDLDKPKLVFFFDEAHLLFNDAPKALVERIELVVRLVRSKGVGVYFVTQNPLDIPETVLGQLGNRVQHALRAFTPRDQKAVKSAADTMRSNPGLDIFTAITELAVGEALISCLDAKGRPGVTERVYVLPPGSQIGPITPEQRQTLLNNSLVAGVYDKTKDRESAYEILTGRVQSAAAQSQEGPERQPRAQTPTESMRDEAEAAVRSGSGRPRPPAPPPPAKESSWLGDVAGGLFKGSGRKDSVFETVAKSAARTIGSSVGRELVRGVLGSLLGGSKRR